jgi:hypothetical protein
MKKDDLDMIVIQFEKILEILGSIGIDDERLMSRYVEYRVALELAKQGYFVQVLNERDNKTPIFIFPIKKFELK